MNGGGFPDGKCYLWWFYECGASLSQVREVSARLGFYPRVCDVAFLLRNYVNDYNRKLSGVTFNGYVFHVSRNAARMSFPAFMRFSVENYHFVGGDKVMLPAGANPELACALLTRAGMSNEEFNSEVLNRAVKSPGSAVGDLILNGKIQEVSNTLNSLGKKRGSIRVGVQIPAEGLARLKLCYPEYNFEMNHTLKFHRHAVSYVARQCDQRLMMDRVGYTCGGPREPGYDVLLKDIGANWMTNLRMGRLDIHNCCPVLDVRDASRFSDRMHDLIGYTRSDAWTNVPKVRGFTDTRQTIFTDPVLMRRYMCVRRAEHCPITAPACILLHSAYDMTTTQIADALDQAKCRVASMCMYFDPLMLVMNSGEMKTHSVLWEKSFAPDGRIEITFSFRGDSSYCYTHDYKTYVRKFITPVYESSLGSKYTVEWYDHREGTYYARMVSLGNVPYPRSSLSVKYFMDVDEKFMVIVCPNIDWETLECFEKRVRPIRIVVPLDLFNKVYSYAMVSNGTRFSPADIRSYALSANSRVLINGVSIAARTRLDGRELDLFSTAVYMMAYRARWYRDRLIEDFKKEEEEFRSQEFAGFGTMLWAKLKTWVPLCGEGKSRLDFTPDALTDLEVPDVWKTTKKALEPGTKPSYRSMGKAVIRGVLAFHRKYPTQMAAFVPEQRTFSQEVEGLVEAEFDGETDMRQAASRGSCEPIISDGAAVLLERAIRAATSVVGPVFSEMVAESRTTESAQPPASGARGDEVSGRDNGQEERTERRALTSTTTGFSAHSLGDSGIVESVNAVEGEGRAQVVRVPGSEVVSRLDGVYRSECAVGADSEKIVISGDNNLCAFRAMMCCCYDDRSLANASYEDVMKFKKVLRDSQYYRCAHPDTRLELEPNDKHEGSINSMFVAAHEFKVNFCIHVKVKGAADSWLLVECNVTDTRMYHLLHSQDHYWLYSGVTRVHGAYTVSLRDFSEEYDLSGSIKELGGDGGALERVGKELKILRRRLDGVDEKFIDRIRPLVYEVDVSKGEYVSRSAYKLLEILERFPINMIGADVLDLGAAPGGFSQVLLRAGARVTAVSIDGPIKMNADVEKQCTMITEFGGDITDERLRKRLCEKKFSMVVSDAANIIAGQEEDQEIVNLQILRAVLDIITGTLVEGGNAVIKLLDTFEAVTLDLIAELASGFRDRWMVRPIATRAASSEKFLILRGYRESKSPVRIENIRAAVARITLRQLRYVDRIFGKIEGSVVDYRVPRLQEEYRIKFRRLAAGGTRWTLREGDITAELERARVAREIVVFSHCISADLGAAGHMSKGVATAFAAVVGKPQRKHLTADGRLTVQRDGSLIVVGVITKDKYNSKPTRSSYFRGMQALRDFVAAEGVNRLVCPPMGTMRDKMAFSCFAHAVSTIPVGVLDVVVRQQDFGASYEAKSERLRETLGTAFLRFSAVEAQRDEDDTCDELLFRSLTFEASNGGKVCPLDVEVAPAVTPCESSFGDSEIFHRFEELINAAEQPELSQHVALLSDSEHVAEPLELGSKGEYYTLVPVDEGENPFDVGEELLEYYEDEFVRSAESGNVVGDVVCDEFEGVAVNENLASEGDKVESVEVARNVMEWLLHRVGDAVEDREIDSGNGSDASHGDENECERSAMELEKEVVEGDTVKVAELESRCLHETEQPRHCLPDVTFEPPSCCCLSDDDLAGCPPMSVCRDCYAVSKEGVACVFRDLKMCKGLISKGVNSFVTASECVAADSLCGAGHVRPLPDYYWLVVRLLACVGPVKTRQLLVNYWKVPELRSMCSVVDVETEMSRWTIAREARKHLQSAGSSKRGKMQSNILRMYVSCFTSRVTQLHGFEHLMDFVILLLSSEDLPSLYGRVMSTYFLDRIKVLHRDRLLRYLKPVDIDECVAMLRPATTFRREKIKTHGCGLLRKRKVHTEVTTVSGKKILHTTTSIGVAGLEVGKLQSRIERTLDERDQAVRMLTDKLDREYEERQKNVKEERKREEIVREERETRAETPPPVNNCDRRLVLLDEDRRILARVRPTGFNPRQTCLVSVYKDEFATDTPKLQIRFQRLSNAPEKLSYGRFRASALVDGSVVLDVYLDETCTRMGRDWPSQLHRFIRDMMGTVTLPILMVFRYSNLLNVVGRGTEMVMAELVRVFLDYDSVMHPHRFAMVTTSDEYGRACKAFERFRPLQFVDPTIGMEFWQRSLGTCSLNYEFVPKLVRVENVADYARNAMSELKELWRIKPQLISNELSDVYHRNHLSTANINTSTRQTIALTKGNYGVISVTSGNFLIKPRIIRPEYQYAYDGTKLLAIANDGERYVVAGDVRPAGETLLVCDETELINEYVLYKRVYHVDIDKYVMPKITLVQGVPGCGKTTYILNQVGEKDLVLFSTREGAMDFRDRMKRKSPDKADHYLRKHYRTVHSFIMNREPSEIYERVYIDEALMMHCGEVLYASLLAGAREVVLLGDVNQIPYINRTPQCNVAHAQVEFLCASRSHLSVTYRCTNTVACLLSELYEEGMKSVSNVRGEMTLEHFTNVDTLNLDLEDQVLVFTQAEKVELLKIHKKVSTVHEFQGKQARSIVVVRATGQKYEVFNQTSHCLVAVSRHTERFRYVTADTTDLLSSWIVKTEGFTVADYMRHHLSSAERTTAGGGGVTFPREYVEAPPYLPTMDFHQNILDTYYQWGFSHMTTTKFYDVERFKPFIPQVRYVLQNYCDNITVLQCAYDELFPLNSIHNLEYDVYHANVTEDLELQVSDMMLDSSRLRNYSQPWYDHLRPSLRTCMPQNRPNTSVESLLAIIKRNLNVPEVQGCVYSLDLAKAMHKSFVNSYIPPERRDLFHRMASLPIEPNAVNISEWLEGQPSQVVGNIGLSEPLHTMSLNLYQFMIKSTVKPQLDVRAPYVYSSLQTIAYHSKEINAIFCPVFREIKDRLLKVLGEKFLIFCDQSPDEFADLISTRFSADMFYRPHMEVDMSKFDKSQGSAALDFEIMIMRSFGVPDYLLELWYEAHHNSILVDRDNGLRVKLVYQRKSGDASTFLGNTMFLMAVLSLLFDMSTCDFAAFSGDDSILIGEGVMYDRNFLCANLFNLESKFFRNFRYKYFCSKFLLPVGGRVYFVPDVAKLLTKLGRSDLVNWEHAEEYRVSLDDLTRVYSNAAINEVFEAALRERYRCGPLQLGQVLATIRYVVSQRPLFRQMFWVVPGARLCHDPSRPKLD